jgi:hypothetical protein
MLALVFWMILTMTTEPGGISGMEVRLVDPFDLDLVVVILQASYNPSPIH